jgi:hypothetical protein
MRAQQAAMAKRDSCKLLRATATHLRALRESDVTSGADVQVLGRRLQHPAWCRGERSDARVTLTPQLFSNMISSNGGNVIAAVGSYNGWSKGMTYADATAEASEGDCSAQNNLDYLTQFFNGWMQGKSGSSLGTYCE